MGEGQGPWQGMDQGMWGHTGWGRGPTMALMPEARDPGWRDNSWGARVGHGPDQDSPGPGKQRVHQASRGLAQRGHGGSQAHSQLHLLPGLIIPRPADHTPTLTWFLTSTDLQPSQPAQARAWPCSWVLLESSREDRYPEPHRQLLSTPRTPCEGPTHALTGSLPTVHPANCYSYLKTHLHHHLLSEASLTPQAAYR